ncbi:hypothetical protein M7I_6249 [Glarea lozoyensis 74030]|uniref:Uncharacterized protein n=1 Tax=Glarea lozoyensis (strain ATCC 74030 / MF5533) TaxID=1104152 RepID=H0EU22_GLAL7|nr:hypothetical protein M7I_6249 [Glarea lozoyensis 74030]
MEGPDPDGLVSDPDYQIYQNLVCQALSEIYRTDLVMQYHKSLFPSNNIDECGLTLK